MKNLILAAALFFACPLFAQSHPIQVTIVSIDNTQTSQTMANMLTGRIGASSRYSLVSAAAFDTDILLGVGCLPNIVAGKQVGVTCDTELSYWPVDGVALSCVLEGNLAVGSESEVAEMLFDEFIRVTSNEALAKAAKEFKHNLNLAIARFPHGVV